MRRYWIDKSAISEDQVLLQGELYHHIITVCRMKEKSRFEVLTEGGLAYLVELMVVLKKSAVAKIIESRQIAPLPKPYIHLVLSVPRYPVLESVIEKCVELGVHRLVLVFSDFSFIRKHESISSSKVDRWNKILVSSTQQSGRGDLMELVLPQPIEEVLNEFNQSPSVKGLFAYEGEGVMDLKQALQLVSQDVESVTDIWTFVGSEGGYSDQEVEQFRRFGLEPISLGAQVMRVETACTALISIIKYHLDLMR